MGNLPAGDAQERAATEVQPSAAFTPAPWCWAVDKHNRPTSLRQSGSGDSVIHPQADVGDYGLSVDPWNDVSTADASLIAAAPDLHRQLKFAVAILEEARFRLGYEEDSLGQIEIDEAIDDGYAVLAKAEGRT